MPIRTRAPALLTILAGLLIPVPALASGGGGDSGPLLIVLLLIAVVAAAYLLTHSVVEWLQRVFLVATSIEYLILGALVGFILFPGETTFGLLGWIRDATGWTFLPESGQLGTFEILAPFVALAAGWIGLLYGMALDVQALISRRDGALRLAMVEGMLTAVPVAFVTYAILVLFAPAAVPEGNQSLLLCAGVMGTIAWAGSTSAMDVVRRRYQVAGETLTTLVRAARFSDMLAILAFGVIFASFHGLATPDLAAHAPTARAPTPAEWSGITLGLGAGLGLMFAIYLDEDDSDNGTLLALVGIIAFASGAAYYLDLSEITINLVLGMILVNVSRSGAKVRRTVQGTYRPVSLLLLLLAGLMWDFPPVVLSIALSAVFFGVRFLGKAASGWVASLTTPLRSDLFRGMIGQGDVAIAMAVSFKLVYDIGLDPAMRGTYVDDIIDATYTAILVGVMIHEVLAPRLLKGLLVDTGEIRREVGGNTTNGGT